MQTFQFKVLKKDGKLSEGVLDASTKGQAMRKLNEQGMQILSLVESKSEKDSASSPRENHDKIVKSERQRPVAPPENRLSSRLLIQFTEEVSDMLTAGVQLDAALASIGNRSESEPIRRVASSCHARVRDGVPFAMALRASSASFSDLYLNLVSAGEVSGALADILKRQVTYLTTLSELRGKLATAMVYPFFLIVSGIGVSLMFTFFLIPKLRGLVESTGGELPMIARFMMGSGDFLIANWVGLLISTAIVMVSLVVVFQGEAAKRWWDERKLRIPLVGKLLITQFNVQFVETLSNLLNNGVPLVKALELVEGTTANRYIRKQISEIRDKVSEGALLNRSLEKAGTFEPGLIDMVRIGEDTGQLSASMTKAGVRLDREFSRSIDRLASVIQPAIILVMSIIVGIMSYMMISVIYGTISMLQES
ncbi:MAG: type II secretion system F family protein [Verrucomicrobiota bacterium]